MKLCSLYEDAEDFTGNPTYTNITNRNGITRTITNHGHNSYKKGCRCQTCVTEFEKYKQYYFKTNGHGTLTGYNLFKCRCEPCVTNYQLYNALHSERKKSTVFKNMSYTTNRENARKFNIAFIPGKFVLSIKYSGSGFIITNYDDVFIYRPIFKGTIITNNERFDNHDAELFIDNRGRVLIANQKTTAQVDTFNLINSEMSAGKTVYFEVWVGNR